MNWLRPSCRWAGSSGAERASAKNASASCAPDVQTLVPVSAPAPVDPLGAGADARQVRARVRLAHPDAEDDLAAADARQERLLLLLRAVAQQRRPDLPLRDPVGRDGRPDDEQLLRDDEPLEVRPALTAVLGRDDHPQPAAPAQLTRELAVPPGQPRVDVRHERPRRDLVGQERANLEAQLGQRGQLPGTGRDETGRHAHLPHATSQRFVRHSPTRAPEGREAVCRPVETRSRPGVAWGGPLARGGRIALSIRGWWRRGRRRGRR